LSLARLGFIMGVAFLGRTKGSIGEKELGRGHCSKQQIEMIK